MGEENKVVGEGEKKKKESVGAIAVVGDGEEEKNKKKKKSKKQGLISRMWNGIFRRRSDDFEKWLQYISKEEAVVMARFFSSLLVARCQSDSDSDGAVYPTKLITTGEETELLVGLKNDVAEATGFLSMESIFIATLGIALLVLLGLWIHGQIQHLSKKTKRAPKVEVGTRSTDASMDE
ncbi:uncharacterized protein DS421_4g129980 [Arachis hypogaea]|nr:uncharacterized protein DS421_4g129980 [Arachis hypogaea]